MSIELWAARLERPLTERETTAMLRLLPEEGTLPPGLAPLPPLALLWECGRMRPRQIRIFPA